MESQKQNVAAQLDEAAAAAWAAWAAAASAIKYLFN